MWHDDFGVEMIDSQAQWAPSLIGEPYRRPPATRDSSPSDWSHTVH